MPLLLLFRGKGEEHSAAGPLPPAPTAAVLRCRRGEGEGGVGPQRLAHPEAGEPRGKSGATWLRTRNLAPRGSPSGARSMPPRRFQSRPAGRPVNIWRPTSCVTGPAAGCGTPQQQAATGPRAASSLSGSRSAVRTGRITSDEAASVASRPVECVGRCVGCSRHKLQSAELLVHVASGERFDERERSEVVTSHRTAGPTVVSDVGGDVH